jgi:hypothetical protein
MNAKYRVTVITAAGYRSGFKGLTNVGGLSGINPCQGRFYNEKLYECGFELRIKYTIRLSPFPTQQHLLWTPDLNFQRNLFSCFLFEISGPMDGYDHVTGCHDLGFRDLLESREANVDSVSL